MRDLCAAPASKGSCRTAKAIRLRPRPVTTVPLLVLSLLLAGCRGVYDSLPIERTHREFGPLIASAPPLRTSFVSVTLPGKQALRLAVFESGTGTREELLVFVPGVLSDGRMWRYVRSALGAEYDVMIIDPPGCGRSDAFAVADEGTDAYTPECNARAILGALRAKIADRPVTPRITLIGHSLGGTTILRMYADEQVHCDHQDVLAHVERVVLFAPADGHADTHHPTFREIVSTSDLAMEIAEALGILRERVAEGVRDSVVDRKRGVQEEAARLVEILSDPLRRRAGRLMLLRATPVRPEGGGDSYRIERITRGYANVNVPCTIIWGDQDDVLLSHMGYKLAYHLPQAELVVVTLSKHCLPTERPLIAANLVRRAISKGYTASPLVRVDGETGAVLQHVVPAAPQPARLREPAAGSGAVRAALGGT